MFDSTVFDLDATYAANRHGLTSWDYCPPGLLGHIARTLEILYLEHNHDGVAILPERWQQPGAVKAADDAGWRYGASSIAGGDFGAWATFWRPDSPKQIHVGIKPLIDWRRVPLFGPDTPGRVVAERLSDYRQLVGTGWRGSSGTAGCALIRDLYQDTRGGRQPAWMTGRPGGIDGPRGAGDTIWIAPHVFSRHRPAEMVVQYDTNAAFLAAAGTSPLAWGALKHGVVPFGGDVAGYWRIETKAMPIILRNLAPPRDQRDGTGWCMTPTMRLYNDFGYNPPIVDAWTHDNAPRILRKWAHDLGQARLKLADQSAEIGRTVKRTWSETIGMLGRQGGRIYRPDWRETIIEQCRATLVRKIIALSEQGITPVRMNVDAVWLIADHTDRLNDVMAGLVGEGVGKLRQVGDPIDAAAWVDGLEAEGIRP